MDNSLGSIQFRLIAIYIIWGDPEIFHFSIESITPLVDDVIVVYSRSSNFGEHSEPPSNFHGANSVNWEPDLKNDARTNETAKRNYGLNLARKYGATHFLILDEDEFYEPEEFQRDKYRFLADPELIGLVGRVKCYFASPTLTIGYDVTLVPMIHKIIPGLRFEFNRAYPFAWDKSQIKIDPTRSMNLIKNVEWTKTTMHHYSWIRSDVKKKIRNSTARANIERSTIVEDYINAKEGYFCKFYGKTLEAAPNVFGLPEITDESLRKSS